MRTFFVLVGLSLFSIGCSDVEPEYELVSDVSLLVNQEYVELLYNGISSERGYSIVEQAKNYSVSEIRYVARPSSAEVQFIYKPKEDFIGKDIVVIKNCISAAGSDCTKTEFFKYIFNVKRQ